MFASLKKRWRSVLVVGAVLAGLVGFFVYWNVLRVDPAFVQADAVHQQKIDQLDQQLGLRSPGDDESDDFDDLADDLK